MAGDWIPICDDLHRKAQVLEIAQRTERSPHEVVGILVSLWSWAVREADPETGSVSVRFLSGLCPVVVPAMSDWDALIASGWVIYEGETLTFTKWNKWLSKVARARFLDTLRKRETRKNLSGCHPDKNRTRDRVLESRDRDDDHPSDDRERARVNWNSHLAEWNQIATHFGLPTVRGMTDDRKRKLRSRLREHPRLWAEVRQALTEVGAGALEAGFLRLDWVLKPANLQKLLEGNYRNWRHPGDSGRLPKRVVDYSEALDGLDDGKEAENGDDVGA